MQFKTKTSNISSWPNGDSLSMSLTVVCYIQYYQQSNRSTLYNFNLIQQSTFKLHVSIKIRILTLYNAYIFKLT